MSHYTRDMIGYPLPGPGGNPMRRPVAEVYIHHEGGPADSPGLPPPTSVPAAIARCRADQLFHVNVRGWADIAYSGLFDNAGNTYEGRGWNRTGAHTEGYNSKGYGFCWMSDSRFFTPTDEAVAGVAGYIRQGIDLGWLIPTPTIVSHSDRVATSCCGPQLIPRLDDIRDLVYGTSPTPTPTPTDGDPLMLYAFQLPATGQPSDATVYVRNPATGRVSTLDSMGLSLADYNELVTAKQAAPFVPGQRIGFGGSALLAYMDGGVDMPASALQPGQTTFTNPRPARLER